MARIRSNNCFGTTTDNPLLIGGTTLNSAGLANLAVVAGTDTAVITLDPNRVSGAPEIVIVTAHTGSATSATITRGAFGTAARQHASGTFWVHAPAADGGSDRGDYYETGVWPTWTPVLTQSATVTATVSDASFLRVGRIITFFVRLTATATGTAGNNVTVSLPVQARTSGGGVGVIGSGTLLDSSASLRYNGVAATPASTTVGILPGNSTTNGYLGVVSFVAALGSGDIISISGTYEAGT